MPLFFLFSIQGDTQVALNVHLFLSQLFLRLFLLLHIWLLATLLNNFDASKVFNCVLTVLNTLGLDLFSASFVCLSCNNTLLLPHFRQWCHNLSYVVCCWVAQSVSAFA